MTSEEKARVYDTGIPDATRLQLAIEWIDELRSSLAASKFERQTGFPLREWFAGQALVLYHKDVFATPESVARFVYQVADAMIAEGAKKPCDHKSWRSVREDGRCCPSCGTQLFDPGD